MNENDNLEGGAQKPASYSTQFKRVTDRWSRTVIVGIMGIFGLTMLGIAAILFDKSDGATLGAIVAGVTSCVGAVAGRQSAPGSN